MVYTSDIFTNLINQYSTWSSLSEFLSKKEGGSVNKIQKEDSQYAILRYVKGVSDITAADKPWVRWMRSVVWDTGKNRPVCVAPPKAIGSEVPTNLDLVVEEFVEGVMINGFIDENGELKWTSRSVLGANTGFYGKKTFAEMMEDGMNERGCKKEDFVKILQKGGFTFASFVMQHPEHRVVQKIEKPNIHLIHLGSVAENGQFTISEKPGNWSEEIQSWAVKTYTPLAPGETALHRLDTMIRTAESHWQGLVFRGINGDRWRIRTLSYKILRDLRGKESRIEERFIRLRAQNMVRLYLQNWSEEQNQFSELEKRLRGLTSKIYTEYCAVHKEKSKTFMDVDIPFRTPIYFLHGIYLNYLRPKKLTLKMPIVINYINNMTPEGQIALLKNTMDMNLNQGQT